MLSVADLEPVVPELLAAVRGVLRTGPDLSPRTGVRGEAEQALLRAFLECGLADPGDEECLRRLDDAARAYGAVPRRAMLDPGRITGEFAVMRQELWEHVRRQPIPARVAHQFILQVDQAISRATTATIRGTSMLARWPDPDSGSAGQEQSA